MHAMMMFRGRLFELVGYEPEPSPTPIRNCSPSFQEIGRTVSRHKISHQLLQLLVGLVVSRFPKLRTIRLIGFTSLS